MNIVNLKGPWRNSVVRVSANKVIITHHGTWRRARKVYERYVSKHGYDGVVYSRSEVYSAWCKGGELVYITFYGCPF